jgi:hypothetical protein
VVTRAVANVYHALRHRFAGILSDEPSAKVLEQFVESSAQLDQYDQQPQLNDRFNLSYQRKVSLDAIFEANYFFNYATRIPYTKNLNMMDPRSGELRTGINATSPTRSATT